MADRSASYEQFLVLLRALEGGYQIGWFGGRKYGVTIDRPADGRITRLLARELGGADIVSFNLFQVAGQEPLLKPCEMAAEKVIDFVLGFKSGGTAPPSLLP